MLIGQSLKRLKAFTGLILVLAFLSPTTSLAQGKEEIILLAQLGAELTAQREAEVAAAAEAEHRKLLEEQSRLKAVYQQYLGGARRTAQDLVAKKWRATTQEQVEGLRRQARVVIDEVDDPTKQRVRTELDVIYAKLEKLVAITPADLLASDARLGNLRKELGRGEDLGWVDRAAIMYALCPDKDQAAVIANNIKFREDLSEDEADAIDSCNFRRLVLGLNPLAIDMKLVACSRDHSSDMIKHNFFAHDSPVTGKTTPWDRAKNFGTEASGENIAAGYNSGEAVTMGWWYSPGHLKNMMGKSHKRISVGQEQQHYTQMFGR